MAAPYPGAPHQATDFVGLPARVQDDLRRIRNSYPRLERNLFALLNATGLSALEKSNAVGALFGAHQEYVYPRLQRFVAGALPVYTAEAEALLHGAVQRQVSESTQATLLAQLSAQQIQPDMDAALRVRRALGAGADPLGEAYGFLRKDGSKISLGAAGQARVRTSVNAFQAETQLARYRDEPGVEEVQFVVGGLCRYRGEGGTCNDLHGMVFPLDAIPSWAAIPRHPYSNSRWVPFIDIPGVDTGGPPRKRPPADGQPPTAAPQAPGTPPKPPAAPTAPAGPPGASPTSKMDFGDMSSPTGRSIQDAMGAVDKTHRIPDWFGRTKVFVNDNAKGSILGEFRFQPGQHVRESSGGQWWVSSSDRNTHPELVAVHEFGHRLDHSGLPGFISQGKDGSLIHYNALTNAFDEYPAELQQAVKDWLKAVRKSEAYKRLTTDEVGNVKYWRSAEECWARSYAQWVAETSGHPKLQAQVRKLAGDGPTQWSPEDFREISAAVKRILEIRGLL